MKPKVNVIDATKKIEPLFERVVFKISRPLYFGYLADVRFLKPAFKEILHTLYILNGQQLMQNNMVLTGITLLK